MVPSNARVKSVIVDKVVADLPAGFSEPGFFMLYK